MNFFKRRDFLKKTILSSAFVAGGLQLFANESNNQSIIQEFPKNNDPDFWEEIKKQFYIHPIKKFFNVASMGLSSKFVVDSITQSFVKLEIEANHGHKYCLPVNEKIATFLKADVSEIAITRNTTEGINIAAHSLLLNKGDEVILTKEEHIGGTGIWIAMAKERGIKIKLIDLDPTGKDNLTPFKEAISEQTKVVVFSHVTCTRGIILPAKEIVAYCKSKNIITCVDGAQAIGMIPVNLTDINPDFYAGCGHKWLLGPKGTGILYINKNILNRTKPVFVGAYTDKEFDLNKLSIVYQNNAQREEYGTRNASLIIGLGASIDFIEKIGFEKFINRSKGLAVYFKNELIKNDKIELITPLEDNCTAGIVTFKIKGINNDDFDTEFRKKRKIYMRAIYENKIDGIRASFSVFNTMKDVKDLVDEINLIVKN